MSRTNYFTAANLIFTNEKVFIFGRRFSMIDESIDAIFSSSYYFNELDNYAFEGASGMKKMADMMENLRNNVPAEISGSKVVWVGDYKKGTTLDLVSGASGKTGLPSSNVLSYRCENGSTAIVRPSGTEPKIKIYITAKESSRKKAAAEVKNISEAMKGILGI